MRLLRRLLTGALVIAALAPAASDAYSGESMAIEGVRSSYLPERTYGDSVLIHAAEGTQVGEIPVGALEPAPAA